MSPFSSLLHALRVRHGLGQADLAEQVGYEQSYISSLEVGLKGPPTAEFVERLAIALDVSPDEHDELRVAAAASQRKLVIDPSAPLDVYLLLKDLRGEVERLTPEQVRAIRAVLAFQSTSRVHRTTSDAETWSSSPHCVARREKREARM